jgi:hypothetical protein
VSGKSGSGFLAVEFFPFKRPNKSVAEDIDRYRIVKPPGAENSRRSIEDDPASPQSERCGFMGCADLGFGGNCDAVMIVRPSAFLDHDDTGI